MSNKRQKFPWKRFWCPPEVFLQLEKSGYLVNPEGDYGKILNPDVVSFESIHDVPCLILLGEPGIGKSQAIEDEIENLKKAVSGKNEHILSIDLKAYASEELLWKQLFESGRWEAFKKGQERLHLFIDSLDEARLRIPTVASLIAEGLKTVPTERLSLRIACRTAEWPWSLNDSLGKFWDEKQVKVYELVPLRLLDVQTAANMSGINESIFVSSIDDKDAGPLASKPITLNLLLSLFKKEGGIPTSQAELYKKGCLYLCEEHDLVRREMGEVSACHFTSTEQRFVIACRIAACLTLSNRFAIYTDTVHGDMSDDNIHIKEVTGGQEKVDQNIFEVSEQSIKETLNTGLFTSRGVHLMGFAHQTYAEFLTAVHLKNVPFEQIQSLFAHPNNINKIIPQLHETVAWQGGQRADVVSWLISLEPEILLRSDVARLDGAMKQKIVSELLIKFDNNELFDDRNFREYYNKLSYPKLAEQLEPYLSKKEISLRTRYVAIEIAESCGNRDLQVALIKICLDKDEDYELRVRAASAIYEIADEDFQKNMEPLARGEVGDDPYDRLRAFGMKCMWPKHWRYIELLNHITVPTKTIIGTGTYFWFLKYEVLPKLDSSALTPQICDAINIIIHWPYEEGGLHPLSLIADKVVSIAWLQLPDRVVMDSLSNLILTRIKTHRPICDTHNWNTMSAASNKRRKIVKYILENADINEELCGTFAYGPTPILLGDDFLWLLDEIKTANPEKENFWSACIMNMLRDDYPREWIDYFLEVRSQTPVLQKKYSVFWELNSEVSKAAKDGYMQILQWQQKQTITPPEPPISDRIATSLEQIEEGNIASWFNLAYELSVDQDKGEFYGWNNIIQGTPGWKISDITTQNRIRNAARLFTLNFMPESDDWFGKNSYTHEILSIYMSIRLTAEDNEFTDYIPEPIWERLVPYIIDTPGLDDRESFCRLFNLAYQKVPETTKMYFQRLLVSEYERNGRITFVSNFKQCWNDELTKIIIDQLALEEFKPEALKDILEFLIDIKVPDIDVIIIDKIRQKRNSPDTASLEILLALLLKHFGAKHWTLIWDSLEKSPDLSDNVFVDLANRTGLHVDRFADTFEENQLSDLYVLMSKKYPPEEDTPVEGRVTARQSLGWIRNGLLNRLVNKGTKEACLALEDIVKKMPSQHPWIIWKLKEAYSNMLRKTWSPPSPSVIIGLLHDPNKRYIESEEQLLAVVLESLNRMQTYYKGLSRPVIRVWNYEGSGNKRGNFRPKDEEDLSDEIYRWISDDLGPSRKIVVNREVQPQRGQKTDIYVNTFKYDSESKKSEILTIVIEVKGCWNDELFSAMENQLTNTYMLQNGLKSGIYLVGCYMCDKWDNNDPRKAKTPKVTFDELRKQLQAQADQLKAKMPNAADVKLAILDLSL